MFLDLLLTFMPLACIILSESSGLEIAELPEHDSPPGETAEPSLATHTGRRTGGRESSSPDLPR